jgi:hypothetical protein
MPTLTLLLMAWIWAATADDMRLNEFVGSQNQDARLAALAEFLVGRADDSGSSKKISTTAFINLARNMGISLNDTQLRDLSQKPPLNNIISNVTDTEIIFSGSEDEVTSGMSVDQARATVDSMAKSAVKKRM